MKSPLMFNAGRGTCFEIDGPDVVITRDDVPLSRVPFADLLEFASNHPLRAVSVHDDTIYQHTI